MSFLDGFITSSYIISCLYASYRSVARSLVVRSPTYMQQVAQNQHRTIGTNEGLLRPTQDHRENMLGGVQSLKPIGDPHWLLDYLFTRFSMA